MVLDQTKKSLGEKAGVRKADAEFHSLVALVMYHSTRMVHLYSDRDHGNDRKTGDKN